MISAIVIARPRTSSDIWAAPPLVLLMILGLLRFVILLGSYPLVPVHQLPLVILRSNLPLGLLVVAPSSSITEGQRLDDPLAAPGASLPPIAKVLFQHHSHRGSGPSFEPRPRFSQSVHDFSSGEVLAWSLKHDVRHLLGLFSQRCNLAPQLCA